jgi:hypothetical protein
MMKVITDADKKIHFFQEKEINANRPPVIATALLPTALLDLRTIRLTKGTASGTG